MVDCVIRPIRLRRLSSKMQTCQMSKIKAVQAVWNAERTESGGGGEVAGGSEDGEADGAVGVDDVNEHRSVVVVTTRRRRDDEVDAEADRTTDRHVVVEHRP